MDRGRHSGCGGTTVTIDGELRAAVEAWVADDPDPVDRAELASLLDAALAGAAGRAGAPALSDAAARAGAPAVPGTGDAARQLADRFAGRLTFGTAGLRGQIGAGPNRMNRAVVRGATSAVAGWLL